MDVIIPNVTGQGGLTRASSATYFNSSGVLTTAGVDVVRIGFNPLNLTDPPMAIIESAATNILLNSATLATQNVSVTASTYTLSFYGSGSVVLSGSATGNVTGSAVANTRTTHILTASAGTLTLTDSGSCTNAQLELGVVSSSYIATTASAVTRAADIVTKGLVYSNIPEDDFPVWSSSTTYAVGPNVILNHRKYNSLRASNLNFNPTTDVSNPPYWLDIGPTNRYAMVDGQIGTQTITATSNITVVIKSGLIGGVSFMEMDADKVQISMSSNGQQVYSNTISMGAADVFDWSQYFFNPTARKSDSVITNIPLYTEGIITVVISAPSGTVKCGNLVAGNLFNLGSTSSSPTVGIVDYSVKVIDAFGNPTLTKRAYSKRMNAQMLLDSPQVDSIVSTLASVRSTPCVWIGSGNDYTSLIVYGYYKDFEVDIAYTTKSYCTLQIEGLI